MNNSEFNLRESIIAFLNAEQIAIEPVMKNFDGVYLALADWIMTQAQSPGCIIGINGAQGSGKSTLCKLLAVILQQKYGRSVAVLSLDDFYLSRVQRERLARDIHPLLKTRGVPGTHDVGLALSVLDALRTGRSVALPRFDKAADDCLPFSQWPCSNAPVDLVLFEGWCVGAHPQPDTQLQQAVNELEATEDSGGVWRRYVNAQLAGAYQDLFAMLDVLIMLQVPSFEKVHEWRGLQESRLVQPMPAQALRRFIMHYERLTRYMLAEMPQRVDRLLRIDEQHQILPDDSLTQR